MMMTHLCLRGNAYNQIVPGLRGGVEQLIPLHPDRIKVELLPSAQRIYKYNQPEGGTRTFRQDEMMHTMWLSTNGVVGDDPIPLYGDTVGHQKAQEEHGARLFKNGGIPSVILSHPGTVKKETAEKMSASWIQAYGGENSHKPAILEDGMTVHEMKLTNEASQWLESRKLSRSEIAGIFRVPAHMINDMESATFSNIDAQDLFLSKHTMLAWVKNFEQVVHRDLLEGDERFFTELSLDGLQRGDLKTRTEFYRLMWNIGVMSQNEIRQKENFNPIKGGDRHWVPVNMMDMNEPRPDNTGRGTGTAAPEGRIESDSQLHTDGQISAEDQHRISDDAGVSIVGAGVAAGQAIGTPLVVQSGTPQGDETGTEVGKETPPEQSLAERFAPFISDVSRRIAHTETTALARRAKHAKAGDKRFEVWASEWFATKGVSGSGTMLQPMLTAAGMTDGSNVSRRLVETATAQIENSGDIAATVAGWQDVRAAEIREIITEEVTKCQTE